MFSLVKRTALLDTGCLEAILENLENSGAMEVVSGDIQEKSAIADFIVIASGHSQRHVVAIANRLSLRLRELGCRNILVEGLRSGDWILIDMGDIIVHIFRSEVRSFYELENIWINPEFSNEISGNRGS